MKEATSNRMYKWREEGIKVESGSEEKPKYRHKYKQKRDTRL